MRVVSSKSLCKFECSATYPFDQRAGAKQSGIKEKILKFLKDD